jgi:hypothetical protein
MSSCRLFKLQLVPQSSVLHLQCYIFNTKHVLHTSCAGLPDFLYYLRNAIAQRKDVSEQRKKNSEHRLL